MADIIRRAMPPDFGMFGLVCGRRSKNHRPRHFRHLCGTLMTLPLAILAAANLTPSRFLYHAAGRNRLRPRRPRPGLGVAVSTAVGLGPFPGRLALSVHSIGMLGRLFAETTEHMDMAPIDALTLTGARRVQVFHGIIPSILPSLLGDRALPPRREHPFVAGSRLCRRRGIGFELLSAMSLFQCRTVSLLPDCHLCHRDSRRGPFGAAPRPPWVRKKSGEAGRRCIKSSADERSATQSWILTRQRSPCVDYRRAAGCMRRGSSRRAIILSKGRDTSWFARELPDQDRPLAGSRLATC